MSLPPLPTCSRSVEKIQPDREWNRDHKHWLPGLHDTQAREAHKLGTEPEALSRCAACAADIKTAEKPKCSECKLVSSGCLAERLCLSSKGSKAYQAEAVDRSTSATKCQLAAFPVHKTFCQETGSRVYAGEVQVLQQYRHARCTGFGGSMSEMLDRMGCLCSSSAAGVISVPT